MASDQGRNLNPVVHKVESSADNKLFLENRYRFELDPDHEDPIDELESE